MTIEFHYVVNINTGKFYVGGSYGGRFSPEYPKLYRRKSDALRAKADLEYWRGDRGQAAAGGFQKGDTLDVRKAMVTL